MEKLNNFCKHNKNLRVESNIDHFHIKLMYEKNLHRYYKNATYKNFLNCSIAEVRFDWLLRYPGKNVDHTPDRVPDKNFITLELLKNLSIHSKDIL